MATYLKKIPLYFLEGHSCSVRVDTFGWSVAKARFEGGGVF